jgi:NTE family protein
MSDPQKSAPKPSAKSKDAKALNLALQGGGAHGAFTWGVLEELLEEDRIGIEAITATSAGAVNAAAFVYGYLQNGRDGAKEMLHEMWYRISAAAAIMPLKPTTVDKLLGNTSLQFSPPFMAFEFLTKILSPYQFNIFDINPLRRIVDELIDFDAIRDDGEIKLFINATHVLTGKGRVFRHNEITLDTVMASACLPFLFKTVEIDGEPYWDGGYSGNPALHPLFYNCTCEDIMIVQINPVAVEEVPLTATDILDRVNEISFNSSLMPEIRSIMFVHKLIEQGKLSRNDYKDIHLHLIECRDIMAPLGRSSKMNADWEFLQYLRDAGKQSTREWLDNHFDDLGVRHSFDVGEIYL